MPAYSARNGFRFRMADCLKNDIIQLTHIRPYVFNIFFYKIVNNHPQNGALSLGDPIC